MIIFHLDRAGNSWRFNVPDCTRSQAGAFARLLRDISRVEVPRPGPVSRRRTPTEKANAEFCAQVETVVLEALAARFPSTPEDYANNDFYAL